METTGRRGSEVERTHSRKGARAGLGAPVGLEARASAEGKPDSVGGGRRDVREIEASNFISDEAG